MYEETTYEVILQRMLARIPAGFDTREGSVIYDAIAPAAAELAQMYIELDNTRDLGFVGTSFGEYLERLVAEFGMTRIAATNAVVKGTFNLNTIPIGSRFSYEKINYTVVSKISDTNYRLECETSGTEGNIDSGRLIPIDYIEGLTSAEITELLIPARDTETDDELKERYFANISGGARDGNVAQYEKWCEEYPGIGRYKIFPLWDGAGTVKVSILNENNDAASNDLVSAFQNYLDPGVEGLGNGVAPIGAAVTVSTASNRTLAVTLKVTLKDGYDSDETKERTKQAIQDYFREIAYVKDKVVRFSFAARILEVEGIDTIATLTVASTTADITLGEEQIPVLGTFSWTVNSQ